VGSYRFNHRQLCCRHDLVEGPAQSPRVLCSFIRCLWRFLAGCPESHRGVTLSLLAAVDPGLRTLGLSIFNNGELVHAALIRNPEKKARGPQAWWAMAQAARAHFDRLFAWEGWPNPLDEYVVEIPQVYRFGKTSTDPDDLIQIAAVGAAVGTILRPKTATGFYPRQWKGQVPKEVMGSRIESRLTDKEAKSIVKCATSLRHNIVDSVGIGLYHLGRLANI
jgi:hypothetical protein